MNLYNKSFETILDSLDQILKQEKHTIHPRVRAKAKNVQQRLQKFIERDFQPEISHRVTPIKVNEPENGIIANDDQLPRVTRSANVSGRLHHLKLKYFSDTDDKGIIRCKSCRAQCTVNHFVDHLSGSHFEILDSEEKMSINLYKAIDTGSPKFLMANAAANLSETEESKENSNSERKGSRKSDRKKDSLDGSPERFIRENGRFGSYPKHDDYSEKSQP